MAELISFDKYIDDPAELKKLAEKYGYLYFKNFVDPESLLAFKRFVVKKMAAFNWLDDNYPIEDAIVKEGVFVGESHKEDWELFYKEIIKSEELTKIAFDSNILKIVNSILEAPVLPHCRKVFRAYSPSENKFATPPHRDYTWTGGSKNFWTAWIPLCTIDSLLGGLDVVPCSHLMEYKAVDNDERKGWQLDDDTEWASSNLFELGDVVFFSSWTIHAGKANNTKNKIRLSLDFRYQNADEPIREDSMCAHWNEKFKMSWEEIYKDWSADNDHKYFWKKFSNVEKNTDETYEQDIRSRYILHKIMNSFIKNQKPG